MLKLNQIEILNSDEIIVEVMEPIVYPKSGNVIKSDETIAREKANVFYTIATVVKVHEPLIAAPITTNTTTNELAFVEVQEIKRPSKRKLKVGDNLIVPRSQITPIQFPIEGYDSPKLGVLNIYAPFAFVREDI
jgi:hypothetical protein